MIKTSNTVSKFQTLGFVAMYCVVFVLIATKAFTLPITHDEAWTVLSYTKHSAWEVMMYPDTWPNNHILNTLLAKCSIGVFGVHDWSVRLPNLLFFWVYSWGVYRFLKAVFSSHNYLFIPAAMLFVISPYFLDFFGLCRGYGISSGLTMLSLSLFVTGFQHRKDKHIWWAIVAAIFASYANFTVLVYWAAATCIAAAYFMTFKPNWKKCLTKWGILALVSFGYLALIALPIYKMKSTGQFVYWSSNGFYQDTIVSVVHASLSDSRVFTRPDWIAKLIALVAFGLWGIVGLILVKRRFNRSSFELPIVVTGIVLFATVAINLIQTVVLDDPNLNGRTALFLLPIFTAFAVTGLTLLPDRKYRGVGLAVAAVLSLVVIQHLTTTVRMSSFKEWRYDANTFDVLSEIKSESGEEVTLATHWLFNNSFHFYTKYESYPWLKLEPYDKDVNPNSDALYYYVTIDEVENMEPTYEVVKRYNGEVLMRKR